MRLLREVVRLQAARCPLLPEALDVSRVVSSPGAETRTGRKWKRVTVCRVAHPCGKFPQVRAVRPGSGAHRLNDRAPSVESRYCMLA